MTPKTVYTKTAKGVQQVKDRSIRLPRDLAQIFLAVDGKSTVEELPQKTRLDETAVIHAIGKLTVDGYIKALPEQAGSSSDDDAFDLDFTSPIALAKLNVEVTARGQAEAAANARATTAKREAAEARARQQSEAKGRAEAEQKVHSEAQARAKAERDARIAADARIKAEAEANVATEATARAEAEARVRIALEAKTRADTEAKIRAEAEQKAQIEARARLKAETQARTEAEARIRAEAEAKARAEAEAKARAAVEAKMQAMEEALRLAEQRAQAETAARARAESETAERAIVEAKARAEAEARAKAAEAAAAEARALAESAAAARAEAEEKARAEVEARTAAMARNDKTKDQIRAEIDALSAAATTARHDAERAAQALSAAEAKIKTEMEARVLAEARVRDEAERWEAEKLQREAELQVAREEADAQIRTKLKALEDNVRNAREEAESRARVERKGREEAERALSAARIGHEQAMAKAQTETVARIQAEQKALSEKKARAAAEDRAKQEAVARVMQEHQLRQRADKEVQTKVEAEIKARQRADIEAEAQARADAQIRAEHSAARRTRSQSEAADKLAATAIRRPSKWGRTVASLFLVLIAMALGALQFTPLSTYIPAVQQLLSDQLQQPVNIAKIRFSFFPSPQLRLENIAIGAGQEIKIDLATVPVNSWAIVEEPKNLSQVTLAGVSLDQTAVGWFADWAQPHPNALLHVSQIVATNVKLGLSELELPTFDATINLGQNGAFRTATLHDTALTVQLKTDENGLSAGFSARGWMPPLGPSLVFADISGLISADREHAVVSNLAGQLYGGSLTGNFTVNWSSGFKAEGAFDLKNLDLTQLLPLFTPDFVASGTLNAAAKFSSSGQTAAGLFAAPRFAGTFMVQKGTINNLDIVRAVQAPARGGVSGGRTEFDDMSGEFQIADSRISYRNLKIASGPMNCNGTVDVAASSELSGRLDVQITAQTTVIARGTLNVGGSVKDPVLEHY